MFAKKSLETAPIPRGEEGIVELSLMLSRQQFDALQQRARFEGLSVAQFLRRLVHDSISDEVPA